MKKGTRILVSKSFEIKNKAGLHMRPANLIADEMAKFNSEITVKSGDKSANGKSIISLLSTGLEAGESITVFCSGSDEKQMLSAASKIIEQTLL